MTTWLFIEILSNLETVNRGLSFRKKREIGNILTLFWPCRSLHSVSKQRISILDR